MMIMAMGMLILDAGNGHGYDANGKWLRQD